MNTNDRANLLLINFPTSNTTLKLKKKEINLKKIYSEMDVFSKLSSYQICFHNNNLKDYSFKQIQEIKELNFEVGYKKYNEKVNQIYNILLKEMENNNSNIEKIFSDLYDKEKNDIEKLIFRKFNYGKKILEEELNKEYYIDFIFKIIFFMFIDYNINENDLKVKEIQSIYDKLVANKNKICNDHSLKNYEKIFLLIELYSSKIILKEDYLINYLNLNNIEKYSPMYHAQNFLANFIKDLDYDSKFYYPLLSIDSGKFNYNIKKNKRKKLDVITTFGFNMLSLDQIKSHLYNMLPNVIILTKYLKEDEKNDDGGTNILTGNITLNLLNFKEIKIGKNELKENASKHYGFIISRILLHELFGHKKSSYSLIEVNNYSIISFKDEFGKLKFLSNKADYLFKKIGEVKYEEIGKIDGESGYFLEYHLGKIHDIYTCFIIDDIEDETYLGVLLDSKLWHKELPILNKYVELKYIILKNYKEIIIDDTLDINQQISLMKNIIDKDKDKIKNEKSLDKEQSEEELDKKIIEKFKDIKLEPKKRKSNIFFKKHSKNNQNLDEEEHLNLRDYLFKYGFYKK